MKKISSLAELSMATLVLAARDDAPLEADRLIWDAFDYAAPRMSSSDRRRERAPLEALRATGSPLWLPCKAHRLAFQERAKEALARTHDASRAEAFAVPANELFELEWTLDGTKTANVVHISRAHKLDLDMRAFLALIDALEGLPESKYPSPTNDTKVDWQNVSWVFLRMALRGLLAAAMAREWVLLVCDRCGRYFPRYGKYHRTRARSFCSTSCRTRFHQDDAEVTDPGEDPPIGEIENL